MPVRASVGPLTPAIGRFPGFYPGYSPGARAALGLAGRAARAMMQIRLLPYAIIEPQADQSAMNAVYRETTNDELLATHHSPLATRMHEGTPFGRWLKARRRAADLTQDALGRQV